MAKIIFLLIGLFYVSLINTKVYASPPAPAPKCYIKGIIQNVLFQKGHEDPCVQNGHCPTDIQLKYPDRYNLTIKIQTVSYLNGNSSFRTCETLYPLNSLQDIILDKSKLSNEKLLYKNQIIEGIVSSFWGSSFDSYKINSNSLPVSIPQSGNKLQTWLLKINDLMNYIKTLFFH